MQYKDKDYELQGDNRVLNTEESQNDDSEDIILMSEIQEAIKMLKKDKSPGVDNIPGERIQAGGEHMATALHNICNQI